MEHILGMEVSLKNVRVNIIYQLSDHNAPRLEIDNKIFEKDYN